MASRTDFIYQLTTQGLHARAADLLKKELSSDPENGYLHLLLSWNLLKLRNLPAAEEEAREALRCSPRVASAHRVLGDIFLASGRTKAALESYREALALDPNDGENHYGLGRGFQQKGDVTAARESYSQARSIDPKNPKPHYALASLALDARDLNEAETNVRQALTLLPDEANHLWLLASIRYYQGDFATSREICISGLRVDPNHARGRRLLCWLKAKEHPVMAPWWYSSALVDRLSEGRKDLAVPGAMFVAFAVFLFLLRAEVHPLLAFVLIATPFFYLWAVGMVFDWSLKRETRAATLKADF